MTWTPVHAGNLDAVLGLVNAVEEHDASPWKTTGHQLEFEIGSSEDPRRDTFACIDPDGAVRAAAWISANRGGARKIRALIMLYVAPELRTGPIADDLVDRVEKRAIEIMRAVPGDLPRVIRSWAPSTSPVLRELHERHGYTAERFFSERRRPTADPTPSIALPDGVEMVPWRRELSEATRAAHNEAFSDHWGSEPWERQHWEEAHFESPDSRVDLSFAVMAGTEVAGYTLNEHYPEDAAVTGISEGWVGSLGVVPAWRRRGIASALLVASIDAFRSEGLDYASLAVDAASETGALDLYEGLGFAEFHRTITYVKDA